MYLVIFLFQLLQITKSENVLPDLNLKLFEETDHPIVFVACKEIDEFCEFMKNMFLFNSILCDS